MRKTTITTSGKSLSTKHKLAIISSRLRRGDITAVAVKTGYDQSHVSRVLSGQRNNVRIVDAAYSRVNRRKVNA